MGESSLTSLLINSNEKSSPSLHDKTSQLVFIKSPHLSRKGKGKTASEFNILSTHFFHLFLTETKYEAKGCPTFRNFGNTPTITTIGQFFPKT